MLRLGIAVARDAHALEIVAPALGGAALLAHARPFGEEQRDAPLRGFGHALDQRPVDLLGAARAEGLAELGGDLARLGDQQHAGGVAVEPMNQRRTFAALVAQRLQHAVDVALCPEPPCTARP